VRALEREADGRWRVVSARGAVSARRVINAAGAWSPEVARLVGVELPTYPIRHEICSSEPLKPFLGPMVSELASGLYFSQSMRGEIVGGVSLPPARTYSRQSTLRFLTTYARRLVALVPTLAGVKVLRQWAGSYDMSPDGNPILGCPDGAPELYLACGFVGHGFMMAPVIGQLYAEWLTGGPRHEIFDRCRLDRFAAGAATATADREDFNIG
jgi:sarcosine oxidase subunit beta